MGGTCCQEERVGKKGEVRHRLRRLKMEGSVGMASARSPTRGWGFSSIERGGLASISRVGRKERVNKENFGKMLILFIYISPIMPHVSWDTIGFNMRLPICHV